METKEKIKKVEDLIERYKNLTGYWDQLEKIFGEDIVFNGLGNATWGVFQKLQDNIAEQVGDKEGWISYWIYDCELGKKGVAVKVDGAERKLENVKQLVELIEELEGKE